MEELIQRECIFPADIMEEILFRMAVRKLLQFRCVSKSWCLLIDSTKFIKKQHEKQNAIFKEENDMPLLFDTIDDPMEFYLLSKRSGDVPLCLSRDFERDSHPHSPKNIDGLRTLRLAGFVNGIALVEWYCFGNRNTYMGLWNPATREFKVVCPPRLRSRKEFHSNVIGLGFDHKSDNLKIIRSIGCVLDNEDDLDIYRYEIYLLNTESWKSIDDPRPRHDLKMFYTSGACDGYIKGVYYWPCEILEYHRPYLILSFDFSNEVFKVIDPPPLVNLEGNYCFVSKYKDSLAFLSSTHGNHCTERLQHFEIWVMTEFDDPEIHLSWKHLFTIGPFPPQSYLFHSFRMDGDMFITIRVFEDDFGDGRDAETGLYNPTTNTFDRKFGLVACSCYEYGDSLFRLSKRQIDF